MAIASVLNPERITQEAASTSGGFERFISGNSPTVEGSNSLQNAANNIVNFSTPQVQANNSYVNSLVQKISSNLIERIEVQKDRTNDLTRTNKTEITNVSNDLSTRITNIQNQILRFRSEVDEKQNQTNLELSRTREAQSSPPIQLITRIGNLENQVRTIESTQNRVSSAIVPTTPTSNTASSAIVPTTPSAITALSPNTASSANEVSQEVQSRTQSIIQTNITTLSREAQSILDNSLQKFLGDYTEKIKGLEDAKPKNLLNRFIKVYNNAISFANYFGDDNNIKSVSRNLTALRDIFRESFDVAKTIRQTIVKIVAQLSNLPSASSSAGNMNLDLNVPGGMLRQSAPEAVKNVGRGGGRMGMLGKVALGVLAVAGTGAVAYAATQAGKAEEYTETELERSRAMLAASEDQGGVRGIRNSIDSFTEVITRLSGSMEDMVDFFRKGGRGRPGGEEGGEGGGEGTADTSGGGGGSGGAQYGTPEEKALLDAIAFAEGTKKSGYGTIYGGKVVPELERGELTIGQVLEMQRTGKINGRNVGYGSGSSDATGRYQFMSYTLREEAQKQGISLDTKFTPELQDKMILSRIRNLRKVTPELLKSEGLSAGVSNMLAPEFASLPTYSGGSFYGQPVKKLSEIQKVYKESLGSQSSAKPSTTGTVPAPGATPQSSSTKPSSTGPQSSIATPMSGAMAQATPQPSPSRLSIAQLPEATAAPAPMAAIQPQTIQLVSTTYNNPEYNFPIIIGGDSNTIVNSGGGGGAQSAIAQMPAQSRVSEEYVASSNISNPNMALAQRHFNLIG